MTWEKRAKPAVLGGVPAFSEPLHVGRPNLPDRNVFNRYIDRIFQSRWLTNNGPLVLEFQKRLEDFLRVDHVVPICNGTIALELAERALGFQKEVIVPSFTFVATAHSLQWQQIKPVFADIGEHSVTLSPDSIRQVITADTSGIVGVHVFGNPCDHQGIMNSVKGRDLGILYDAAHAFGCEVQGQPIASLGDASVFSFHATKFFNSFEGGAIATNNASLAEQIRHMTNFGFTGKDRVDYLGVNGKMTEITAAMGLAMMESVEDIRELNRRNFQAYRELFSKLEGFNLIEPDPTLSKHNWQYVIVSFNGAQSGWSFDRDGLVNALEAENILVRRYFHPGVHAMQPYRETHSQCLHHIPNTLSLTDSVIAFPTGQAVNEDTIEKIGKCLKRLHLVRSSELG